MEVDINSDPPPDPTLEKLEAEQAKVIGKAQPTDSDEPTLLAGKYKDPAELEKAYLELQTKLGSETKAEPAEEGGDDPAFSFNKEGGEETPASAFNAEKYQQEFIETGKLTDESMKEMRDLNIPQEMIDTHIAGLQAIKDARSSAIVNMFGNKERMDGVIKWANSNLTEGELAAIQTQANSTDMGTCETAIKGLVARFDSSPMGQEAPLEGVVGGPSVAPFKSTYEMTQAMGDERYEKDPAYRQEVADRVAAT